MQGRAIGPNDLLIAAHARSLSATLATANVGELKRGKGLKVLAWKQFSGRAGFRVKLVRSGAGRLSTAISSSYGLEHTPAVETEFLLGVAF